MMVRVTVFIISYIIWLLLAWPCHRGQLDMQVVWLGVAVALLSTIMFGRRFACCTAKWWQPRRYWWALVYAIHFGYEMIKANIDIMIKVLHPALPIRPGIVRVRTKLESEAARVILANSITLTPGTLTVDMLPDGTLYIHCVFVEHIDMEAATRDIVSRFEFFLAQIFE